MGRQAIEAHAPPGELGTKQRRGRGVAVEDGGLDHRGDPPAAFPFPGIVVRTGVWPIPDQLP